MLVGKRISIILAMLSLGLIPVLPADAQTAPKKGGVIVEAMGTEPTNLDTFKARRQPELRILHLILEPLVVINPSFKIEPLLDESWKSSADAKTWPFTLKKGIKFHNGEQQAVNCRSHGIWRAWKKSPKFLLILNSFAMRWKIFCSISRTTHLVGSRLKLQPGRLMMQQQ